jgi:hypothetical protein
MEAEAGEPGVQFLPAPIEERRGHIEPVVATAIGEVRGQSTGDPTAAAADLKHLRVRLQARELDDRL